MKIKHVKSTFFFDVRGRKFMVEAHRTGGENFFTVYAGGGRLIESYSIKHGHLSQSRARLVLRDAIRKDVEK